MSKMSEYAIELSEALGHDGEFNNHVQAVYAMGCKVMDNHEALLVLVKTIRTPRDDQRQLPRDADGTYPVYAWPGGYPIYYMSADTAAICAKCANGDDYKTWDDADEEHLIVGSDVNWEDSDLYCDDCNGQIETAYGDDDDREESKIECNSTQT